MKILLESSLNFHMMNRIHKKYYYLSSWESRENNLLKGIRLTGRQISVFTLRLLHNL